MLTQKKKVNKKQFETLDHKLSVVGWILGIGLPLSITLTIGLATIIYQTSSRQIESYRSEMQAYRNETKATLDAAYKLIDYNKQRIDNQEKILEELRKQNYK